MHVEAPGLLVAEQVWLAAVKLESENSQPEAARSLLAKARERAVGALGQVGHGEP